jgi:hypothetical protein
MFVADVFNWSLLILFGSATLTTFLGKVSNMFAGSFPDYGKKLRRRLARTDLCRMKITEYQETNTIEVHAVAELVERIEFNGGLCVDNTLRKKEILVYLLEQTEKELDDLTGQGTQPPSSKRDIAKLVREERILLKVLRSTSMKRKLLESEKKTLSSTPDSSDDREIPVASVNESNNLEDR